MNRDLQREEQLAGQHLQRQTLARLGLLLRDQWWAMIAVMALQALAVSTIVARPWFIGQLIDFGLIADDADGWRLDFAHTGAMALGLAALWGARFIFLILARTKAVTVVVALLQNLRNHLYQHLMTLSMRYFDLTRAGRVVSRVDRDVDALQPLFLEGVPQLLGVVLRCTGGAIMLAIVLPSALIGLLILAPLLLGSMWAFKRLGTALWGRVNESNSRMTAHLVETISGVALVQQSGAEKRNLDNYDQLLDDLDRHAVQAAWGWGWFMPYVFMLFTLGICVVIITGGSALAQGEISPGRLTECIFYVFLFLGPLMELGDLFERASSGAAAAQRIFLLLDTTPEVIDPAEPKPLPAAVTGHMQVNEVHFRYTENGPWVLQNCYLDIPAGSTVAIVGATGHGKSTLVQLLARFHDPQQGSITFDGLDIRDLAQHDLRQHVSIVLQDNILFSGTVMANLQLANPNLSEAAIHQQAEDLGVATVIERLPHGWLSEVGPRGDQVSHGQRQIICLLRAWLANPKVLILDEATSAIDVRTEQIIQQAFRRLMHGRTAVVVAHRLATVRDADRIVVIEHGRVAETGSHSELLELNGAYARLHQRLVRQEQL